MVRPINNIILSVLFLALLSSPFNAFADQDAEEAPSFFLSSLSGQRFISKKQHAPYLISFFFVDCRPCIKEIPALYAFIQAEFPEVPLLFIDPVKTDTVAKIKHFAEQRQVPEKYFYRDALKAVAKKFYGANMSFPYIVGIYNNRFLFQENGYSDAVKKRIRKVLVKAREEMK